jgi:mono/diheme cytochrome c family protein
MRDRLPCAGCHTYEGKGGRIGPDLSQVAGRRPAEYVRRVIEDPQRAVPATIMPKVPMAASTRELIIAYLTRGAGTPTRGRQRTHGDTGAERRRPMPAPARAPSALYQRYCAPCHGPQGGGDGPNAKYLPVRPARHADSAFMSRRSDDRLFDAIYSGGYPLGRSVTMPPYGETFSRVEVWSLVRHLRELCRCSGPAWSTDGDGAPSVGLLR